MEHNLKLELPRTMLVANFGGEGQPCVTIEQNLDKRFIPDLVELSRQEHIQSFTPRDAAERFADEATAEQYVASRNFYALRNGNELAGIIWFGQKEWSLPLPSPSHTYAIRMYQPYLGKGLASVFSERAVDDFISRYPRDVSGLWLETDNNNRAALALYESTGWTEVARRSLPNGLSRVSMVYGRYEFDS